MSEPKLVDRETSARALLEQREQSCSILLLFNHHQQQQQQPSPSPLSIPCCCLVFPIESQQMKERDCTWKGRNRSGNEAKRALCHQHYLHLHGNAQRFPLAMNTLSAKALWLAPTRQPKSALSIFLSICLCLFLSVGRSVSDWSTETHEHLDTERRQQQDPSKTLAGLQFQLQRGREIKLATLALLPHRNRASHQYKVIKEGKKRLLTNKLLLIDRKQKGDCRRFPMLDDADCCC